MSLELAKIYSVNVVIAFSETEKVLIDDALAKKLMDTFGLQQNAPILTVLGDNKVLVFPRDKVLIALEGRRIRIEQGLVDDIAGARVVEMGNLVLAEAVTGGKIIGYGFNFVYQFNSRNDINVDSFFSESTVGLAGGCKLFGAGFNFGVEVDEREKRIYEVTTMFDEKKDTRGIQASLNIDFTEQIVPWGSLRQSLLASFAEGLATFQKLTV